MKILYTGATKQGAEQLDASKSLGGLVSGTMLPNDTLSNIFSSASLLSIQNKRRETKLIALKNNNGDIVSDVSIKFAIESDSICKYKVAFVSPTIASDHVCFEEIQNPNALPFYATFQDIVDGSEFDLNVIENDAYLGIWLIREFNYDSDDLKSKTCEDWYNLSLVTPPADLNQKETFSFTLDYTIGEPSVSNSNSSSSSISI